MRVLLVGGGAREHAMAAAIRRNPDAELFCVLKTPNPGILRLASEHVLMDETDVGAVVAWARERTPHVAVVGPEAPLERGLADALVAAGIPCASPSRAAARIETDKTFMRTLMEKHNVPGRLAHHPFTDKESALRFLDAQGPVWAIKPVGLTGGKGVQVHGDHFTDIDGAKAYAASVFDTGAGGGSLQFEELAVGEEFTLMAFTDGQRVLPMVAVQDHKRLREGDAGPNTGGMGAYSQADGLLPFLERPDVEAAARIVGGIVSALAAEGCPYGGAIYGQFMLTATGPRVIEVNARLGDPEAMNVLHLLDSDYPSLLRAMARGDLTSVQARFRPRATVVKYAVPTGYGEGSPTAGAPVSVDEGALAATGATVYYANIHQDDAGNLTTLTSRTLAVLGEGDTIAAAEAVCEAGLAHVHGDALFVRHDIGKPALLERRVRHMQELRRRTLEH